jgi:uncharacterized membrane protein
MKLKKRKIQYSAIFFLCWFALLVFLPTLAVYIFTKE